MKYILSLLFVYVATLLQPLPLHAATPHLDGVPYTEATQHSARVLDQIIKVNNYWQAHNTP